jgi:ribose-phosphate pyrophosphokinase
MDRGEIRLFALGPDRGFGERVARGLGIALSEHEDRDFEDGEHKSRPLVNVRGCDAFVVQSLYADTRQSVNDKLCRLLFFIGALRDADAARVTAVVPYLCYARKDRKTKSRDPVTTRYVAALFEAVGTDRVVTLDVHNLAAYQNAFRCRTEHLEARPLFVAALAPLLGNEAPVVVSPDVGGVKRAKHFRDALSRRLGTAVPVAFMEKQRSAGVITGEALVGDVGDQAAVAHRRPDRHRHDAASRGPRLPRARRAEDSRGLHGLFVGDAAEVVADPVFEVLVTDYGPAVPPAARPSPKSCSCSTRRRSSPRP